MHSMWNINTFHVKHIYRVKRAFIKTKNTITNSISLVCFDIYSMSHDI